MRRNLREPGPGGARRPGSIPRSTMLLTVALVATLLAGGCDLDDDDPIDLGTAFDIQAAAGGQESPDAAFSRASDEHLVVYMDGGDVRGNLVSDDGTTVSAAFDIRANANLKANPAVAWSSSSDLFLVVWDEEESSEFDVMGQMVDATGSTVGTVVNVTDDNANDQRRPAVAYSPASDLFLAVWEDARSGAGDILAQGLSGVDASDVGANFFVGDDPEPEAAPDLAWQQPDDEFLVAFERDDGTGLDEIFARPVDAASQSPAGSAFEVDSAATTTGEDLGKPAVAYSEDADHFGVTYLHEDAVPEAHITLIHDDGTVEAGAFVGTNEDDRRPAIGWDDPGEEFLVVWDLIDGSDRDLVGRLVDDVSAGTSGLFSTARGSGDQIDGALSRDPDGDRFLLVWQGDGDIRGRLVD